MKNINIISELAYYVEKKWQEPFITLNSETTSMPMVKQKETNINEWDSLKLRSFYTTKKWMAILKKDTSYSLKENICSLLT